MKVSNELLRTSNKTNKSKEFTQIVKTKWSLMLLIIVMLMPQGAWAVTVAEYPSGDYDNDGDLDLDDLNVLRNKVLGVK